MVYVEVFRNIPPLLVIFFWYSGVLAVLPQPRESLAAAAQHVSSTIAALPFPKPIFDSGAQYIFYRASSSQSSPAFVFVRYAQQAADGDRPASTGPVDRARHGDRPAAA